MTDRENIFCAETSLVDWQLKQQHPPCWWRTHLGLIVVVSNIHHLCVDKVNDTLLAAR